MGSSDASLLPFGSRDCCGSCGCHVAHPTQLVSCYPCHPSVGTGVVKTLCSSLCDTWYSACSSEFYASSVDGKLSACLDGALVCSKLDAIVESGAELCARMGYRVADTKCYDGQSMPHPTMCTLYGVCELIVLCYHFGIAVAATPGIERKAKGTDSKTKAVLNKLRCVRFWMVLLMVLVS